jgi:hypothetical protein
MSEVGRHTYALEAFNNLTNTCPHHCSIPRWHDKWCEKFKCICVEVTTCEGREVK